MRKILIFFTSIILLTILIIAIFIFQHVYNFSTRIAEDICIDQVFMKDEYNLINCTSSKVLIQNASEWIVKDSFLYGIATDDREIYFLINTKNNSATLIDSYLDFNDYLNKLGLPNYNMSNSEGMVHLLYGAGRDRIFPTEDGCCVPWRRR